MVAERHLVRGAGSLLGGIQPQHRHPRHGGDEAGYCGDHWECHQRRYITRTKRQVKILRQKTEKPQKKQQGTEEFPSAAVQFVLFRFPYGRRLGQEKAGEIRLNFWGIM